MCNEIGCLLNFYEDTILTFEDTSVADADAHQKFDKDSYDASSRDSKEFSNKRKCIDIERGTCSKIIPFPSSQPIQRGINWLSSILVLDVTCVLRKTCDQDCTHMVREGM